MPTEKPKAVRSSLPTRVIRGALPLPLPAAQLVASTITRDDKFGFADAPEEVRNELIRSVMNARKRTGKNKGGTEYNDYSQAVHKDIQSLDVNLGDAIAGSIDADDFRAATTFGRVSYDYDPDTDTYSVYDSYDFSKTPNTGNAYSAVRSAAGAVGVKESSPKLIGTFKGADYADFEGSDGYTNTKKTNAEAAKGYKRLLENNDRMFSPVSKFKKGGKIKAKKSKTSEYYAKNPEAAEKRRRWQRKENKKESKKKYRAFLNRMRRKAGRYGNGDGMDYDHGERRFMSARRNRSKK